MIDATEAWVVAERYLAGSLPRRWLHVRAVAARAEAVAHVVPDDQDLLVSAAWLHDVGYAPALDRAGFHPLDGARYLRDFGAQARLCSLVAHHSGAAVEAELRGLADELQSEFPQEHSMAADALWYADMTTGPDGESLTVEDRLADIAERYGAGHVVAQAVERARPVLIAAVRRTEQRLAAIAQST